MFYEKLKVTFQKNRLTRKLFDLLFVTPSEKPQVPRKAEPAEAKFREHEGQIISNVQIRELGLLEHNATDTSKAPRSWLQKTLNKLHTPTRHRVIRKNLFMGPGDEVDPLSLADSERILRSLPFIRDARIQVVPHKDNPDSVDLLVLVQDVFPFAAGGSFSGFDKFALELNNINMVGTGHGFSNELIYNNRQGSGFGYRGIYSVPNISGWFIDGWLEYANTDWEKTEGFNLERAFFTPEVRWAGGLQHYRTTLRKNLLYLNPLSDTILHYQFHHSDAWGAWAFRLWGKNGREEGRPERSRIILAARFSRTDYRNRPQVSPTSNHFFHDNRLYLASIGWSKRHYFRDQYLFRFGRTEDVPYGSLINFTFGREDREFTDYQYAGLSLARGRYLPKVGYLLGVLEVGSFFRDNWQMERRHLHLQSTYYSYLLEAKEYRFRQIFSIDYQYGDRRFEHEFLRIEERNIRGFESWEQRGTQRLSLRAEIVCFTPFYILGFQFAGYGFADISFLNRRSELSLLGDDFYGYGLGFRIRNDHLTFNTFQLRFSVYPSIPNKRFGISISSIPGKIFQDFKIGKPQPLPFR